MTKKPSLPLQIRQLKLEAANAACVAGEKIAGLEKELAASKQTVTYHAECANKANAEINQLHDVLDALGAIDKKMPDGYSTRPAMTRLAAWLALRGN